MEVLHVAMDGLRDQCRAGDCSTGCAICPVVLDIDAQAGPVVLEHRAHRTRIVGRLTRSGKSSPVR